MKKITLFSNLWRSLVGSREDESRSRLRVDYVSFTSRLRVWQVISSRMIAVFLLLLTLGVVSAWGAADYTYTLGSSDYGTSDHTQTSGTITWTLSDISGSESYGSDDTYGFKFGSGNKSYPSAFKLTSGSVSSKIKKIVITASVNSGKSCKLDVKVGSTTYGAQRTINTKANDTLQFIIADASAVNGAIELSFSSNTGPLYLKKIEVYYHTSGPTITTSSSMTTFGCNMTTGVPVKQSFSVSGSNLTANLSVTPPSGYEICLTEDGTYKSSAISLTPSTGTVSSTTIYVRLNDTNAAGSYSGNIACASTGATTQNVAISGSTPFTVTWKANNSLVATTYVTYATGTGTALGTLPTDPDPEDYSCDGRAFYGWYAGSSYSDDEDAPDTITTSTKITKDTTFNAVFAYAEVGDPAFSKYELVTSAPDDWSGTYVLSTGTYTATGSYSSNTLACGSWTPGTTEATAREFVIAKIGETSTYSIKKGSTYYGYSGSGTDLTSDGDGPGNSTLATAAKFAWQLSTSGIISNQTATRQLAGNASSTPTGIKAYATSNIPSSYAPIKLYKRIEAPSVSYSYYSTSCVDDKCVTPSFGKSAGTYFGTQSVTITCATTGSTIYYTTDNSTPSSSSTEYTGAITVSSTTTIKAIAVKDGLTDSEVASATYTIRSCKEYNLVTDVSTLGMGDKIVILETAGSCALDTTQNASGYRETTTDFALSGSTVRVPDVKPGIQVITLEPYPNASGYWYFNVGSDKYLYATGSSNNYLRTSNKATVTTNANGKWSIALATSVFTVKTNGDATRNKLLYNYNSGTDPRFCCYAENASFTNVKVYALQNTSPTVYVSTTSLSGFSATYGSASEKQDLIIYGRNLTGNLTLTPPSGYEIKKSGDASYSTSAITITPSTGSVTETVNIRIASGTSVGSPSGNISIAGNGNEVSTNVAVSGTVSKATPVITFTLDKSSAFLNEEVGYTLSTTIDGTLTFSYVRNSTSVSSMITNDRTNNKISISEKGTYKIRVNEASPDADKYNAAAHVECELVVSARDTFKDLVNGYSDITKDDDGSGGTTTPTFAEMEDGATDGCNSTTRALIGWIKASDLETQYGTAGETGYLEDAVGYDGDDIIAPGENIEGTGVTWYAVWGEAE